MYLELLDKKVGTFLLTSKITPKQIYIYQKNPGTFEQKSWNIFTQKQNYTQVNIYIRKIPELLNKKVGTFLLKSKITPKQIYIYQKNPGTFLTQSRPIPKNQKMLSEKKTLYLQIKSSKRNNWTKLCMFSQKLQQKPQNILGGTSIIIQLHHQKQQFQNYIKRYSVIYKKISNKLTTKCKQYLNPHHVINFLESLLTVLISTLNQRSKNLVQELNFMLKQWVIKIIQQIVVTLLYKLQIQKIAQKKKTVCNASFQTATLN
eukprot:TRINITY_DN4480_c2_g1_i5.p1 TRINITY_DN4480_c2_g1~~TRINITY_DN4480_c2_g1_i5.p1  ORF type:complete len:260 (-),score=-3.98 TRINITY_DN4480_c2_g1_i5:515-1294(-)